MKPPEKDVIAVLRLDLRFDVLNPLYSNFHFSSAVDYFDARSSLNDSSYNQLSNAY